MFPALGSNGDHCIEAEALESRAILSMVSANGNGREFSEEPYRWSRRWYDDPPVGTEVLLGDGLVEVHVGRGIWQTVDA